MTDKEQPSTDNPYDQPPTPSMIELEPEGTETNNDDALQNEAVKVVAAALTDLFWQYAPDSLTLDTFFEQLRQGCQRVGSERGLGDEVWPLIEETFQMLFALYQKNSTQNS